MSGKNPMEELLSQVEVSDGDIKSALENVQDSFDLSRNSKGRNKKKKEEVYDINSLIDDDTIDDRVSSGIVEDEEQMQEESKGRKNLNRNLGLPPRDELFGRDKEQEESRGRRSKKGERNEEDTGDKEDSIVWKILGALGLALLANKFIDKFSPEKNEVKSGGVIVSVMRIVAILVGCGLIASFAFYIIGAVNHLGINPIDGFYESIDKASGGDTYNSNTNVTGYITEDHIRPYRITDDNDIEILGKDGEKMIYTRETLPKDINDTGYVNVKYTLRHEDGHIEKIVVGDVVISNNTKDGPTQSPQGEDSGGDKAVDKIMDWFRDIKSRFE